MFQVYCGNIDKLDGLGPKGPSLEAWFLGVPTTFVLFTAASFY